MHRRFPSWLRSNLSREQAIFGPFPAAVSIGINDEQTCVPVDDPVRSGKQYL